MRPVPVLMYHHVNPHKGDMVTVTPDVFEGQMAYLAKAGFRTLSLDELFSFITGRLDLKQRAVAITFDDGWLDNFIYAFPVLEKYGLRASIFVTTDWIERASEKSCGIPSLVPSHEESKNLVIKGEEQKVVLTWKLIEEMADSALIDFYSHTRTHRAGSRLTETELVSELKESKDMLEKRLAKPCPFLCWPYGDYTDMAVTLSRAIGYRALFTVAHGVTKTGSDPFAVKRIVIKDNVSWFRKKMLIYSHPVLSWLYLRIKKR